MHTILLNIISEIEMKKNFLSPHLGIETIHFDEKNKPESNKITPLGMYLHEGELSNEEIKMTKELALLETSKKQILS